MTRTLKCLAALSAITAATAAGFVVKANRQPPITAVCRLCGDHICRWTSVRWENCENARCGIEVTHSVTIADLCSVCFSRTVEDIHAAVRGVIRHQRLDDESGAL